MHRHDRIRKPRSTITPVRPGNYRVLISNLPKGFTWKDVKDIFRKVGEVAYTEVEADRDGRNVGYGVVDFNEREAVHRAIKEFDGFYLHGGRIRLCEEREEDLYESAHAKYRDRLSSPQPLPPVRSTPRIAERETRLPPSDDRERTIVVNNINPNTTYSTFKEYFSQYGLVVSADMSICNDTKEHFRGYIVFSTPYQAVYACAYADQQILMDERLSVSLADGSVVCDHLEALDVRSYGGITPSFFCRLKKSVEETHAYQRTGDFVLALQEIVNSRSSRDDRLKVNNDIINPYRKELALTYPDHKSEDIYDRRSPLPPRREEARYEEYRKEPFPMSERSPSYQGSKYGYHSSPAPSSSYTSIPSKDYRSNSSYHAEKPDPTRLYVKNLPPQASWQDVKDHFRDNFKQDKVSHVAVLPPDSRSPSSSAFVYYDNLRVLHQVARRLHNTVFKGRSIAVSVDYDSEYR